MKYSRPIGNYDVLRTHGSDLMTDDTKLIDDYLSGSLAEADAEAFEQRLFADDGLAAELQRTIEIRAAGQAAPAPAGRDFRLPLAAAAVVGALAVGLAVLYQAPDAPVLRGGDSELVLEVEARDGRLEIAWPAVDAADRYRVELFDLDGNPLLGRNVDTASIDISRAEWQDADVIRVRAFGALGDVLADSGLVAMHAE